MYPHTHTHSPNIKHLLLEGLFYRGGGEQMPRPRNVQYKENHIWGDLPVKILFYIYLKFSKISHDFIKIGVAD